MKPKTKIKLRSLSPLFWLGLVLFLGILITVWLTSTDVERLPNSGFVEKKIEKIKDKFGDTHAQVTDVKKNDKSGFYQREIDSLKERLGLKENEIAAITKIQATLVDSVKLYALKYDAEKHKVWEWQKKYDSGSKIEAKMSEKDSTLQLTNVDIKTEITDVYKKRLFKKDTHIVDLFSPDQNVNFNGVKVYRYEKVIPAKRFGLGVQFGYGITENFKPTPYIGLGISYNLANF